jgi:protein TonB
VRPPAFAGALISGQSGADRAVLGRGRRLTTLLSVILHGGVVIAAVAYSYWHVEELTPPTVTVTFVAAAPPPPPPPPLPLGGGSGAPARRHPPAPPRPIPVVRRPELAPPRTPHEEPVPVVAPPAVEAPRHDPAPAPTAASAPRPGPAGEGVPDGVRGGLAGGVRGGAQGGAISGAATGAPSAAPRFLPPLMARQQQLPGSNPVLPAVLSTRGARYDVKAKVCVGTNGLVDSVIILKHGPPVLDGVVLSSIKAWRFRPLSANGAPVPFCYFADLDFRSE